MNVNGRRFKTNLIFQLERGSKLEQRDARKSTLKSTKEQEELRGLYNTLTERGYSMTPSLPKSVDDFEMGMVEVNIPQMDRVNFEI